MGISQPSLPPRRRSSVRRAAVLLAAIMSVGSQIVMPAATTARTLAPAHRTAATVAPASVASHHLSAEVVGYLPYWEMNAGTFADIDLTKLTSVVLFSVGWNASGRLITDANGYRAITRSDTAAFVAAARAAGVRVLVSFTSFGAAKNAAFFSATNAAARATFVAEAAAFVHAQGLDGADLDVELISGTYFGAYAATAGALRAALRVANPSALMTVATNGNTSGANMAAQAIAAGADRAFLMGYAYRSAGSAPGVIDPLARPPGSLSLTASLDLYAKYAVPLDRVLLGLPLYGRSWPTVDGTLGSPRRTDLTGSTFVYQDLDTLRATGTIVTQDYVPVEEASRIVRTVTGVFWQSFYDSQANLESKMRLVLQRHLAGAGLWALGYSTGRPEYWTAIGNVFGPPTVTRLAVVPSPTNTRNVSLRMTWTDGAASATEMRIANGASPFGDWQPIAAATPWTLPTGPTVIRRTIRVQLRDGGDAESLIASTSVLVDQVRPTMTKLTVAWSSTARAWIIRYAGKDVGSGVGSYKIVLRRNGITRILAMSRVSTSYALRIPRSAHFVVVVRARDRAANLSTALNSYH